MQTAFKTGALSPVPVEALAHSRRTAAVAKLIAHHLFLTSEEKDLLCAACLLHHWPIGVLAREGGEGFLVDIFRQDASGFVGDKPVSGMIRGVLNAYDSPGSGTAIESRLAGILRLADTFDQNIEAQPINGEDIDEILTRLRCGVECGFWSQDSIDALEQSTGVSEIGERESWRIPAFPQAALRMLSLMRDPCANLATVAEAARLDPSTAGLIIQLANSGLFGSRTRVSTLSQAVSRLGFATSQKMITAAALKPVFSSPNLQKVWHHSLQVADLSEQLAWHTGTIDPAEAYLVGLLHDVGRIALLSMSLYDSAQLGGLVHSGCPEVYAENLLLRTDHAALGAQIADGWRLPETMVAAIRQHHRPEGAGNPLAHLLYLAEHMSGSGEDLPSNIRLEDSLKRVGLVWHDIGDCSVSAVASWLASAA